MSNYFFNIFKFSQSLKRGDNLRKTFKSLLYLLFFINILTFL